MIGRLLAAWIVAAATFVAPVHAQLVFPSGGTSGGGGSGTVTSIATGCQATGGIITTTGTISTQETPTTLSGSNPAITTGYCGGLENLSNSSAQTPTIAEAGTTGFPAGWYTDLCNINTGAQTLTPAAGTIGGASTLVIAVGTAAAPTCYRLVSDGVSNYDIVFPFYAGTVTASSTTTFTNKTLTSSTNSLGGVTAAFGSDAKGDIYYNTGSSNVIGRLAEVDGDCIKGVSGVPAYAACGGSSGLTVGTTTITSGTNTDVEYNNNGVLGEYAITGTGNVVMSASPTFTGVETFAVGSQSAPSITFTGTSNTGLWAVSTTGLGFDVGGANKLDWGITNSSIWTFATNINMASHNISNVPQISGTSIITITSTGGAAASLITPAVSAANTAAGNVLITAGNASGTGGTSNGGSIVLTPGTSTNGTAGQVTLPSITTDAGLTDTTVCQDTTVHGLHAGSGTAGICLGNVSSIRFKHDWQNIGDGLSVVNALDPATYRYNEGIADGGTQLRVGFSAERYAEILPQFTRYDSEGKPNGLDMLAAFPYAVRAIQQLSEKVEALEKKVEALEKRAR
jgi:Chaperone of endosialidase